MTDKKFLSEIKLDELDKIYDKLANMFCEDCHNASCGKCPVSKTLNDIAILSDKVWEEIA